MEKRCNFASNSTLMDDLIKSKANDWLLGEYDRQTKEEIKKLMEEDSEELTEAFYKDLDFGTGGLRGIMGVGTNRINRYTIGNATQGLANYLRIRYPLQPVSVAVAYDSRNNSRFFASIAADVLSANGIGCYLFDELRPTPELSFAVRYLKCQAGIMITASHNPSEYNGYKVYGADGGQLVAPEDRNLIEEVNKISSTDKVKWARNNDFIYPIGKEVDEQYLKAIHSLSLNPGSIQRHKNLKIVYTPLHGTGITLIPEALNRFGFDKVSVVEEQAVTDGNFPTVSYPNPEEETALRMAIDQAVRTEADLVMATDPDADRVGIAIRGRNGKIQILNGNEIAALLTYYILSEWQKQKRLDENEFIVKTIVTTDLINEIALDFNVTCYDVLTGFKYISEKIRQLEGEKQFICGGEESYGFLTGDFVRDKDAVSTCCMIAEMAAFYSDQNKTLQDILLEIRSLYTYYKEVQISLTKKGKKGVEEIKRIMNNFRNNPPKSINNRKVVTSVDYLVGKIQDCAHHTFYDTGLPFSDVIQFQTTDGSKITIRPSGTEPKIKFYISVKEKLHPDLKPEDIEIMLLERIAKIKKAFKLT